MAKYDSKRRPTLQPRCGVVKHVSIAIIAFIGGYVIATFYDFATVSRWLNERWFNNSKPLVIQEAVKKAELPKPKFEFYTLLTQDTRNNPSPAPSAAQQSMAMNPVSKSSTSVLEEAAVHVEPITAITETSPVLPASQPTTIMARDTYLVQLASFRRPQDAEKMKAALSLKGFTVTIMSVNQQSIQWYRVVLGPFSTKLDAQQAQNAIAKSERIAGMIRKVDV